MDSDPAGDSNELPLNLVTIRTDVILGINGEMYLGTETRTELRRILSFSCCIPYILVQVHFGGSRCPLYAESAGDRSS